MRSRLPLRSRLLCALLLAVIWGGVDQGGLALADSPRSNLPQYQRQHLELHSALASSLEEVAKYCETRQFTAEAEELRKWQTPPDSRLLRDEPLPVEVQAEIPAGLPAAERQWQVQARTLRQRYAKDLYLLSRRVLEAGHVSYAYDLVREVALHDPDHAPARGILGYVRNGETWVTPFADEMLRKRYEWNDTYGWLPPGHLEKYENGERNYKGRWMSAAQEAEIRRDFKQAWEVKTDHYLIRTNASLEEGVELGKQLEDFYRIFFQTFAGFFNSRAQLQQMFSGNAGRRTATSRRFEVHYYGSRDEYNERLRKKIPVPIEITTGLYVPTDKVAYFFHSDDPETSEFARTTLFHEATHQLFSETRPSKVPVGQNSNFWIIEGIACYMESFEREEGKFSLGNPDYSQEYSRFRGAQVKVRSEQYYVPLAQFTTSGQNDFQSDPNIRANYAQGAGLAHFFLHYQDGIYREALIEHLSDIYSLTTRTREKPRSLAELTGVSFAELDQQYQEYIANLGSMRAEELP